MYIVINQEKNVLIVCNILYTYFLCYNKKMSLIINLEVSTCNDENCNCIRQIKALCPNCLKISYFSSNDLIGRPLYDSEICFGDEFVCKNCKTKFKSDQKKILDSRKISIALIA